MKWVKKGLIYGPQGQSWAKHSALQPTPMVLDDQVIRVFVGFRDDSGISRVGYVDVDGENPARVLNVSENPALDIGEPGCFDENGVVPCAVVPRENQLYLYYAGYQVGQKIKFTVYSGLAVSSDNGLHFERYTRVPITERTEQDLFFRVIHSIHFNGKIWRIWYGGGDRFIGNGPKALPVYDVRYMESADGIHFPPKGQVVLPLKPEEEYRVGRPYVIHREGRYQMFFAAATFAKGYRLAYAESDDGIHWQRMDEALNWPASTEGWDSQMVSYPSVIQFREHTYLFYNGNDYGRDGFGYAERVE